MATGCFPTATEWRTHRNRLYNVWLQIYNNVITCKILYYEDISPLTLPRISVHIRASPLRFDFY